MKNIILIAYYFKPYTGVGSFRPSYWYERLHEDGNNITVITNTQTTTNNYDRNIIRISSERSLINKIIPDHSFSWGFSCKKILTKLLIEQPDSIVIITGGPFLHMASLIQLKKTFTFSHWIIDYRDPLANNPRNKTNSPIRKLINRIKLQYERYINKIADKILTVNNVCKEIVEAEKYKISVIDNGYDERCFFNFRDNMFKKDNIVYTGKIYTPETFNNLVSVINKMNTLQFHYAGSSLVSDKESLIHNHGILNYRDNVELLCNSKIGVVLTTGESFESTTKIFDYFAAKLKILIINATNKPSITLRKITENNPNVEWCFNDTKEIEKALLKLNRDYIEWDYNSFSRDSGYKELIKILKSL